MAGAFVLLSVFVLVFLGWAQKYPIGEGGNTVSNLLYYTLQTFIWETDFEPEAIPPLLDIMRFVAPLALATSLVASLMTVFGSILMLLMISTFYRDHVVVFGLSGASCALVSQPNPKRSKNILVIPRDAETARIESLPRSVRIIRLRDATFRSISLLAVHRAQAVVIFDDAGYSALELSDRLNALTTRQPYRWTNRAPLNVTLVLEDPEAEQVHRFFDLTTNQKPDSAPKLDFYVCTLARILASHVVFETRPDHFVSTRQLCERPVSITIHGYDTVGYYLIVEAAHLLHYFSTYKLSITVIGTNVEEITRDIRTRLPAIDEVIDLHVLSEERWEHYVQFPERLQAENFVLPDVIYLNPANPHEALDSVSRWMRLYYVRGQLNTFAMAVVARSDNLLSTRVAELLAHFRIEALEIDESRLKAFRPEVIVGWDLLIEGRELIDSIGQEIHAAYGGEPWDSISDFEREQNRRSARHLFIKLRYLGYQLEKRETDSQPEQEQAALASLQEATNDPILVDVLARCEHRRWMAEKWLERFCRGELSSTPEVRDFQKKLLRINPYMVPYEELFLDIQRLDENTFRDAVQLLQRILPHWRVVRI